MGIGIMINANAQEIVDMLVEVITLLLNQHMGLLMILGVGAVIGIFLLLVFGVCFGMCCYACTKRRSKRLCKCCLRLCWVGCGCGDKFNFEEGGDARDEEERYMMGNGKLGGKHSSKTSLNSYNHHDKDGRITPV